MEQTNHQHAYTVKDSQFWLITISLAVSSFFVFAAMYSTQPLLPLFVREFDVSVSVSSLSVSLTIIGLIIGLIVLGFLSDRNGRTMFIKLSLAGAAIPFLLIPLSESFLLFLIFRFLQGFALAGLPAAALAYLMEEMDKSSLPLATALYISSNALGGMVGRFMTGYVSDHLSWEMAFYLLGGLGFVVLVAVLFMLPRSRYFTPSQQTFSRDIKGFLYHLKNPGLLWIFGIGVVIQLSFTGIWTYLPFHLEGPPFSLSLEAISYLFLAYGLGVVGSPVAGWLSGRFGILTVRAAGIVVMTLGILMTLASSIWIVAIGLCITCLGFFTAHSITASSVGFEVTHHKGSASSLYLVFYYVGVSLGSSALGPLWNAAGWTGIVITLSCIPVVYTLTRYIVVRNRKQNEAESNFTNVHG
ncbi:MFS transporter [Virgibacillus sp. MSP4-1]|uniref:MFS transporter n=1 Tax=Virgibacillus sp. MSP4-1 TaxID=2700081 RepID=UPI0003AB3EED|nr:MFS transporter [Virgibacillus sp. MSP4-1]QHS23541.1 MFS transporter [Virgibacillus sp. MSP4-1]